MQLWFWLWLAVALKIPLAGACWLIWRAVRQQPEQIVGGGAPGGDGGSSDPNFEPGPRQRGPGDARLTPRDGRGRRGARHDSPNGPREREREIARTRR